MRCIRFYVAVFIVLLTGCSHPNQEEPGVWSQPLEMAKSHDSLDTSFTLYKWNNSLLALGGDAGTCAAHVLNGDGENWKTFPFADPTWLPLDSDAKANRFVISRATIWSKRLEATFSVGSFSSDERLAVKSEAALPLTKSQLFPNSPENLELNENERPAQARFGSGLIQDQNIRVPYSIHGALIERKGHQVGISGDVNANGVFSSSDGGHAWRVEPIVTKYSDSPVMCRTRAFYYYFAKGRAAWNYALWYSRCPLGSSSWSPSETINETLARKLSEQLHAIGEGDIVHLCWLDARHERSRSSLTRPQAGNYEVAYCHRKDSDSKWSDDVILSKGLRWSYAPSMSVDGNNLVVAWAGAQGRSDRTEYGPSDIYYVISKDAGNTWTQPVRITDGFEDGITSGRPQVALHKGVIHLFYIQGKVNYKEVSTGMALLNQPPWPIYYTQRPFPH